MQPVVDLVELKARLIALAPTSSATQRTIVGIAGSPGAGKSTIAAELAQTLDAPVAPMDGFHLSNRLLVERGLQARKGAPETFDVWGFAALLQRLSTRDEPVFCPNFDRSRSDNSIGSDIRVDPSHHLVIVEGNYLLLDEPGWSSIKEHLTVSVFVELDQLVRLKRLAARHVTSGRTLAEAWTFIRTSDEPNATRIQESKHHADLLLQL